MSQPPDNPKIYHITHVKNLASIIADGVLVSDAAMIARGGPTAPIGMSEIKRRRLILPVKCHPGDHVGDYVPFNFCPRSAMLYVVHCANHPDLKYRGGQGPIVHLEANLQRVVEWADKENRRWAFTLSNAGAIYAEFRSNMADLDQLDWNSISATDFRSADIKEAKQAEFLVHGEFPWTLVEQIGVATAGIGAKVNEALASAGHKPKARIRPDWYF